MVTRSLALSLLLAVSAHASHSDYVNTATGELRFAGDDDLYTSAGAVSAGWVAVVGAIPPEARSEAERIGRIDLAVWQVVSGVISAIDQAALDATRAQRALETRTALLQERLRLVWLRANVRTNPPSWASEAVLAATETLLDDAIVALDAQGETP